MANYKTTPEAEEDLRRMWFYGLENWGEPAANEYIATFHTHFEHLVTYPEAYPVYDASLGYRRSVHRGKNVFYRIAGEDLIIVAITEKQDTDKHLHRIK